MSLAGFMKQINKANQILSEKIGGAKGTELDDNFHQMEKKTDVINKLCDDLREKTNEFLQPNPASRAKLWTVNNFSKIRGQVKNTPYPQPEGTLGETMVKYGYDLGDDSNFGKALVDIGESLRQMAGVKYALEDNIKQNFLDPLAQLKDNDLKDVMHLRKKMENRRLDYDCKKRKQKPGSSIMDDEVRVASEKFDESKSSAEEAMINFLNNEDEHITYLIGFAEGFLEYHRQCQEILRGIVNELKGRKKLLSANSSIRNERSAITASFKKNVDTSSSSRFYDNGAETSSSISENFYNDNQDNIEPAKKLPYPSINTTSIGFKMPNNFQSTITNSPNHSHVPPPPTYQRAISNGLSNRKEPSCRGLYDFEAETNEELEFKEGDVIKLLVRLDDNWYEGELNGRIGRFPTSYVEIIVPLP